MKLMPFVVMALALLFGAIAVIVFHTPGKPKARPRVQDSAPDEESGAPSMRVPLYSAQAPRAPLDEDLHASAVGIDERWMKLNKEGIQALETGQEDKAVYCFEQCLASVPGEKTFAGNLAEALAQLGSSEYDRGGTEDRKHALEHYLPLTLFVGIIEVQIEAASLEGFR